MNAKPIPIANSSHILEFSFLKNENHFYSDAMAASMTDSTVNSSS